MADTGGRVAWVVGAGSGVGRATAVRLAGDGWKVVLSGRRPEALDETARLVRTGGGEATVLPMDVREGSAPDAARRAAEAWGRLDGLVLAAGLNAPRRTWSDQRMDEFDEIVQTNLLGAARVLDAALPALRDSSGAAVVISSYAGWTHQPSAGVAYGASKTALGTLVRSVNSETPSTGVRACHLCPGDVDTDFLQMRPEVPDAAARARMLTPADVATAVAFVLDSPPHVRIDELVMSPAT